MEFQNISLDDADIEQLDRDLSFAINTIARTSRGNDTPGANGLDVDELDEIRDEIISTAEQGVRIASQVESRSLIAVYEAAGVAIPPAIAVDNQNMAYEFYLAEMTFGSLLEDGMYLKRARVDLNLSDDIEKLERRVRPIRLFPDRKDITYFGADVTAAVGIDFDLNITVPVIDNQVIPFSQLEANAGIKAGFLVGPLQYSFRKAAIEVTGLSDQQVTWRYNLASELSGLNDFKSVMVLKIAREAQDVFLDTKVKIVPYRKRWLIFQKTLPAFTIGSRMRVELAQVGGPNG
jgi:hypothetical protein